MFYDIIVNADVVEDIFNYGVVTLPQPAKYSTWGKTVPV